MPTRMGGCASHACRLNGSLGQSRTLKICASRVSSYKLTRLIGGRLRRAGTVRDIGCVRPINGIKLDGGQVLPGGSRLQTTIESRLANRQRHHVVTGLSHLHRVAQFGGGGITLAATRAVTAAVERQRPIRRQLTTPTGV